MAKKAVATASSGKGVGRKNQEERAAKQARRKAAEAEVLAAAAAAEAKAKREEEERDEDEAADDEAESDARDDARDAKAARKAKSEGKAKGDAVAATATATSPDAPPIDERITRYAKIGVPLGTLGTAAIVGMTLGTPPAVLVLAGGALVAVIATFWASVRTLLGETPLGGADAYALGAPRAEEEQKRAVLRALKDLEFERGVGKISDEDYAELVAKYRSEAKRLLRVLDTDAAPARRQIEVMVARRLRDEGLASSAAVEEAEEAAREGAPVVAKSGKRDKARIEPEIKVRRAIAGSGRQAFDAAVENMAAESAEEEAEAEAELQRELDEEKAKESEKARVVTAEEAERRAADDALDEDLDAPAPAPRVPAQAKVPIDIAAASEAETESEPEGPAISSAPARLLTASGTPLPHNGTDRPAGGSSLPPRIGSLRPAPLRRKANSEAPESKCAECGTMNDPDAVFCKKCGTRRATAARDDA